MKQSLRHAILALCSSLLIAVTSMVFAARMAPVEYDSPEIIAYVAMGGTLADVCGDPGEAAHCPLCHSVAAPPEITFSPCATRAALGAEVLTQVDLALGAQRKRTNVSARAPPVQA